jgi:hypothetical protein
VVRFSRDISKWFKSRAEDEHFLTGLRYETDQQIRQTQPDRPLAVRNLIAKYIAHKEAAFKPRSFSNRPGELLNIEEGHINRNMGAIVIPHPEEKTPKIIQVIPLLDEDVEILNDMPRGLPHLHLSVV